MRKAILAPFLLTLFLLRCYLLPKLDLKDGTLVRVTGELSEEPQILGNLQKFSIGQFAVTTQRYPEYHYGEEIEATGELKTQMSNVKTKTKILKLFTRLQNKYFLSFPEIRVGAQRDAPVKTIKGAAVWTRLKIREVFKRIFPSPYDGIMSGVVIGDRGLIGADLWNKFKLTGTLHMMVASGSNIAMFAEGLLAFLCILFVRRISLVILICLIWFYTLITGFQLPIIRSAIMASLVYSSQFFGRETEKGRVLWLTGLIMVWVNPIIIVDLGFQLSFLSTLGLVYIQPIFKRQRLLKKITNDQIPKSKQIPISNYQNSKYFYNLRFRNLKLFRIWCLRFGYSGAISLLGKLLQGGNFSSSLAAFLATTPILLLNFGYVNLLSPIINLAVLWVIPFLLQAGMGLGLIGLMGQIRLIGPIVLKIIEIFSYLLYPLLFYLEKVIEITSKWTFLQIDFKIGWGWVIIYYLLIWVWVRRKI